MPVSTQRYYNPKITLDRWGNIVRIPRWSTRLVGANEVVNEGIMVTDGGEQIIVSN